MSREGFDYPAWDETINEWSVPAYQIKPGELLTRLGPKPAHTDKEASLLALVTEVRIYGSGSVFTLSSPVTDDPDAVEF